MQNLTEFGRYSASGRWHTLFDWGPDKLIENSYGEEDLIIPRAANIYLRKMPSSSPTLGPRFDILTNPPSRADSYEGTRTEHSLLGKGCVMWPKINSIYPPDLRGIITFALQDLGYTIGEEDLATIANILNVSTQALLGLPPEEVLQTGPN